jgi:phage repressor protein C with HTH and peptisase S24 domain
MNSGSEIGKFIKPECIPTDKHLQDQTLPSRIITFTQGLTYTSPQDKLQGGNEMKDVFSNRRKRLLQLIQTRFDGNQTAFGDAIGRSNAYISFLLAEPGLPHAKNLGEKLASHIESVLGLPEKWLDGGDELELSNRKVATLSPANEGMYELIPRKIIKFSAGSGNPIFEEEEDAPPLAFRKEWLMKEGLRAKDLVVGYAKGTSMEPRVFDGDTILINTADATRPIQDNKIYALRYGDELRLKRMIVKTNSVLLVSDNPSYPDEELTKEDCDKLHIIGRVVWISGSV